MDRAGNSLYQFTNMGRISVVTIEKSVNDRITEITILCSDVYMGYKALVKQHTMEHYILNVSKKRKG